MSEALALGDGRGDPPAVPAAGPDRLTPRDFQRLAEFIQDYSGIKMPPSKATMVEGRLRRRVRALGLANLKEYCRYLFEQDGLDEEAVHLIDAVTTNKTEFFREPEHFRLLVQQVLPDLLSIRRAGSRQPVKLWSAACSTGAEPYTLAMVLSEAARELPGFSASILATDLCTEVLKVAVRGIYPESMIAPIPHELRGRYLLRAKNAARGVVRIVPELRAMVQFGRLNLMDAQYPVDQEMDVIFCRNILIYFDKPTQQTVLTRLCQHLRPGGYLILGHSETLAGFQLPLRAVAATIYRHV